MSIELVLLGEILNLSHDEDISLEEFGEKVASSPSLAAEVVRVSNSALYGMEGRIDRLERAVLILGIRTVASIASSVLVKAKMRQVQIGSLNGDALWTHSLETGVCAQLITRCLSLPQESESYLAGLLHDLGIIEMSEIHGARYSELILHSIQGGEALSALEIEAFKESHETRLLSAASGWGFPDVLSEAIGHHHFPDQASDRSRTLATILCAAHIVMDQHSQGWSDHSASENDETLLANLGLLPEDIADIQELTEERLKEVSGILR